MRKTKNTCAVWKYTIDPEELDQKSEVVLELPCDAQVVHVGTQEIRDDKGPIIYRDGAHRQVIRLWAKVELYKKGPLQHRTFAVLGTGWEYNPPEQVDLPWKAQQNRMLSVGVEMLHTGTVHMVHGLVFHVFELVAVHDNRMGHVASDRYRVVSPRDLPA